MHSLGFELQAEESVALGLAPAPGGYLVGARCAIEVIQERPVVFASLAQPNTRRETIWFVI
jgi:hypothetical protein